jgi:hypothetical protein
MPDNVTPYVPVNPGDLITADIFNTVQEDVKQDIAQQIQTAVAGITEVKHADDAGTLAGLNVDQLTSQILDRVKAMLPGRTGYRRTFNILKSGQPKLIKHGLGAAPVVDVYQLDWFQVVCAQGETTADQIVEWVNFYLYHESERQIRGTTQAGAAAATVTTVTIDDTAFPPARIPFKDMLAEFGVDTSKDGTTLDELVNLFWTGIFSDRFGNDRFFNEQYCHSPWFDKCCGELRTIKQLRDRGDWDHMYVGVRPRKTINYPAVMVNADFNPVFDPLRISNTSITATIPPAQPAIPNPGPTQLQVAHLDFNSTVLTLLTDPVPDPNTPPVMKNQLGVMVVMKV